MDSYSENLFFLNIGAGNFARSNWRIIDYVSPYYSRYEASLIDYNLNLIDNPSFPIGSHSVDLIYTSHILEHLPDLSVENILKESYRILKPEGVIRITVPDIDLAYQAYARMDMSFFDKIGSQPIGKDSITCKFFDFFSSIDVSGYSYSNLKCDFKLLQKSEFLDKYTNDINHVLLDGNNVDHELLSRDIGQHMNWFNENKLTKMLSEAGYKKIKLSTYKQSQSPEMRTDKFDNTYPQMSLYIEAAK